jgi:hypothetical protein
MRHHRVGVAVADAVFGLEPVDDLHVLLVLLRAHQPKPVVHGVAVGLLDGGEVGRGAFDFFRGCHGELLAVDFCGAPIVICPRRPGCPSPPGDGADLGLGAATLDDGHGEWLQSACTLQTYASVSHTRCQKQSPPHHRPV